MKNSINIQEVEPQVVLIASPGRVHTDLAARFCRSPKSVLEIKDSPYSPKLVEHILKSGHLAATEFDYYVFGVENVSRVLETQLVRKRMASYLIASGRHEGKRLIDKLETKIPSKVVGDISLHDFLTLGKEVYDFLHDEEKIAAEDVRYLKPQGTSTKILIGMNAHSLLDWFRIRCCMRAQKEIRMLANKMLALCKEVQPDVFRHAGPNCVVDGFCREQESCGRKDHISEIMLCWEEHKDEYVY